MEAESRKDLAPVLDPILYSVCSLGRPPDFTAIAGKHTLEACYFCGQSGRLLWTGAPHDEMEPPERGSRLKSWLQHLKSSAVHCVSVTSGRAAGCKSSLLEEISLSIETSCVMTGRPASPVEIQMVPPSGSLCKSRVSHHQAVYIGLAWPRVVSTRKRLSVSSETRRQTATDHRARD